MKNKKIISSALTVTCLLNTASPVIYATSVDELQSQVDSANANLSESQSEVATLQSEVDNLTTQISSLENNLEAKRAEIEDNQEQINKINSQIEDTNAEIDELETELDENKEESAEILTSLQKNSNVNYLLSVVNDESLSAASKINIVHGLNQLANGSYDIIDQTINLKAEVDEKKASLVAVQDSLETKQETLATESNELVSESQSAEQMKTELAQKITEASTTSDAQKAELLENANLLSEYEDAGCSGDDVYGVDCAVPIDEEAMAAQQAAQDEEEARQAAKQAQKEADEAAELEAAKAEADEIAAKKAEAQANADAEEAARLEAEEQAAQEEAERLAQEEAEKEAQEEAEKEDETETATSYVAKLKADPDANYIINRESGWNPYATNPTSGAYGICQALPGSKMASAGSDWATNIETQAKWCDSYVLGRYGSWSGARAFWDANNWF